jgi:hypothetical protein
LQFSYDIQGKGRTFVPEISGAVALSFLAAAITLAGGTDPGRAWVLPLVLGLQAVTAISYAGARVRLARGVDVSRVPTWVGHLVALVVVGATVALGWISWPVLFGFAILGARAVWGLSRYRREVRAAIVGAQEVAYTLLTVACLVSASR